MGQSEQLDTGPTKGGSGRSEEAARKEADERRKRKEQEERIEQIRREELARLEKHSEPLRQYLMSLVVPTLTSGLIEVCREEHPDPIGYLAEYLSVYSQASRQRGRPLGGASKWRL